MRDIIRWGIIGCGDVCEVKSGPGFQKARGSALVAVMRRDAGRAADFAQRHRVPRWYDDARALVQDPDVDAVYVATPPGSHLEGVELACAARKPVYVEKPMARHTAECDAMLAACAAAQQKLFVAYYRRELPRFRKAKDLLDAGAVGTLTSISYRFASLTPANAGPDAWRIDPKRSGGGVFPDMGSHVVDLLDFFCGPLPLADVHGHASRLATPGVVEDSVAFTFRTEAGVPGTAAWNFASAVAEDVLEFHGTAARLSLSITGNEPVRLQRASGTELFDLPNPPHVAQPLIQTIVDELLGRGTCVSTGASARRANAVLDRVLDAYYGGRADDFWNRRESWPGLKASRSAATAPRVASEQ
jgi:predicted dehydrogenase